MFQRHFRAEGPGLACGLCQPGQAPNADKKRMCQLQGGLLQRVRGRVPYLLRDHKQSVNTVVLFLEFFTNESQRCTEQVNVTPLRR